MKLPKILLVVTSHSELGTTGKKTGYYLSELTHPFFKFKKAGMEVEIASPKGGNAPMDENSRDLIDPVNKAFLETDEHMALLKNTQKLSDINPKDFDAIVFTGGHGTMWDFPNTVAASTLSATIYEDGGIVAAICHGPAALVNIKLSDGTSLVAGKKVTGFSNAEEEAVQLTQVMPFSLEDELKSKGAIYEKADLWQNKVVIDERLVTGQNPASAAGVGEAIVKFFTK